MDGSNGVGATAAEKHGGRRRGKKTNEREHCFALARPSTAAGARSVAAKCREIVILQSQREFTLATGEI